MNIDLMKKEKEWNYLIEKMTYKIKLKKVKEKTDKSYRLRFIYDYLDNEAYLQYGSKYGDLDEKTQKEIAKKVSKDENIKKWHT